MHKLQMHKLTVRETEIPYEIRKSPRAKRMRIVVVPGKVEVVVPKRAPLARVVRLVEQQGRWIYEKTRALRDSEFQALPAEFVDGVKVLVRGEYMTLRVETGTTRRGRLTAGERELVVTVPKSLEGADRDRYVERRVLSWLTESARETAERLCRLYGERLGARPVRIRIASQKTRWGSCSARGTISLNRLLVAAPPRVFEYVVVHELCHLVEANHSSRFWGLVGWLMPDWQEQREWLRRHGIGLG